MTRQFPSDMRMLQGTHSQERRRVMGEKIAPIRAKFNGSIRVEARPERLTSEAGVLALREAFDRLEMVKWLKERVLDNRNQGSVALTDMRYRTPA